MKVVKAKTTENPKDLGYSVTKNKTSVVANADVDGNTIAVEYYLIPSAEVARQGRIGFIRELTFIRISFEKEFVCLYSEWGRRTDEHAI